MLRYKAGFLVGGLINNYNFIVVFSCAYYFSKINHLINPSLIILAEIVPGFITQFLYPKLIYQTAFTYRWVVLYALQLISTLCLLVRSDQNIELLFLSIVLVSINSYLGESSMLSLSSNYKQDEMKFWSIGTGLAGVLGTGLFLILNLWLNPKVIFGLNLMLYILFFSLSLYLLDYRNKIKQGINDEGINDEGINDEGINDEGINEGQETSAPGQHSENPISLDDFDLSKDDPEECSNANIGSKSLAQSPKERFLFHFKSSLDFFFDIASLCIGYFLAYFIGFLFIPEISASNFEYQLLQFISRTSLFLGRWIGNYHPFSSTEPMSKYKIRSFSLIHLYSLCLILIFTILISRSVAINYIFASISLLISYFAIGLSFPMVYNYVYQNHIENRNWYMGAVGQYTAFFTILGCLIGYPIHFAWKNKYSV
jgi:hypothetical protein